MSLTAGLGGHERVSQFVHPFASALAALRTLDEEEAARKGRDEGTVEDAQRRLRFAVVEVLADNLVLRRLLRGVGGEIMNLRHRQRSWPCILTALSRYYPTKLKCRKIILIAGLN